ncbi:hypothetical protein ACH4OY_04345 [Micromonospora rubida]|uniref:Transposase n=1 Tax=Micromonospora rubida TaxID=2697657 RepID=A0ABW7SGS1_9ACTN
MPSNYLTELDAPLREVGQHVHAVVEVDAALFTGWLRRAYALEVAA